jgi:predicted phosphodiesterase
MSFILIFLNSIYILSPRLAKPVLGIPGDSFEICYIPDPNTNPLNITASIHSEFTEYVLELSEPEPIDTFYKVKTFIPGSAISGLYELVINVDNTTDTQYNAIMVYEEFKDTVNFVQFTDIHIGFSELQNLHYESVINEINTINPDFVIITGDIVEQGEIWGADYWYEMFIDISKKLKVPCFVVSGNHDWYELFFTPAEEPSNFLHIVNPYPNFSFSYGSLLFFLCLDTGPDDIWSNWDSWCYGFTPEQLAYIESQLIENQNYPLICAMMHGPVIDNDDDDDSNRNGNNEFIQLAINYGMDLVLAGHTHEDRLFLSDSTWIQGEMPEPPPPPPYFVQTETTCKDDTGEVGYRYIIASSQGIISFSEDGTADNSIRTYNLEIEYSYNNDSTTCIITINNNNSRTFYNGRVWPHMKPGCTYEVSGPGEIVKISYNGLCEIKVYSIPPGNTVLSVAGSVGITEKDYIQNNHEENIFSSLEFIEKHKNKKTKIFSPTGRRINKTNIKKGIYFINKDTTIKEKRYGKILIF